MQIATTTNLLLIDCSPFKVLAGLPLASVQAEFYKEIAHRLTRGVYTREAINRLGDRLVAVAHRAYTLRLMDVVEQAGQLLINLPLSYQYRSIGRYYHSFKLMRDGRADEARTLLESLLNKVPHQFRGRVMMSSAGLAFESCNFQSALQLYFEAGRAAHDGNWHDWFTSITAQRMLAVLKSIDGDHRGALADLENQFTLVRAASSIQPSLYYGYLNSLAVELGEVERIEEARNVCNIILASPFANAYPECRETWDEIERKGYHPSRSVVSFVQRTRPRNILQLPERSTGSDKFIFSPFEHPGSVTNLEDWKKKMVKEPNGNQHDDELPDDMPGPDMAMKLLELITENREDEDKLRKILQYAMKLYSEPTKKE